MGRTLDRRDFLRLALAAAGSTAVSLPATASLLRPALAGAATVAGTGPYGPLATTTDANGFRLPGGFTSRLLAVSGSTVPGTDHVWHGSPDGGACFAVPGGGWVYVSNSERSAGAGGAGAIRFASDGTVVGAYRILEGTSRNCAGGLTSAGTWLSCEENGSTGKVYECDPLVAGQGTVRPALGSFNHEAAFEDPATGHVYLTEDDPAGRFYRFVPTVQGDLRSGQLYAASVSGGAITWIATAASAPDRQTTTTAFNGGEGLWIEGPTLYFTTKGDKRVWEVDLPTQRIRVLYDGVATATALNAVDNCTVHVPSGDVYVCEDGGNMEVGVLAVNSAGDVEVAPFLRIEGHTASEWCGVAFSPDQTRMYISSQRGTDGATGRTYEITGPFRTDSTPPPAAEVLVAAGGTWRYLDTGADLGTAWRAYHFDDSAWRSGGAPLGYGDPMTTVVSYGPSSTAKYVTTYFRRTFEASHGFTAMTLNLRRDDGAVVYLNGVEIARSNMPSGTVTASTYASTAVAGTDETAVFSFAVSGALYRGSNVLAVEVHQSAPDSSDLGFDLSLLGSGDTGPLPDPPPPPPPAATTVAVAPDTQVRDGKFANTNYGTSATATVQSGKAGANAWYLLRVDTAAHGGPVSRAVLRLRMQGTRGVTTPLEVRDLPNGFTATTVTWNTRPSTGSIVASGSVTGNTTAWYEFDLSDHVAAARAAGRTVLDLAVIPGAATTSAVKVSTAEAAAADRPHVVVVG